MKLPELDYNYSNNYFSLNYLVVFVGVILFPNWAFGQHYENTEYRAIFFSFRTPDENSCDEACYRHKKRMIHLLCFVGVIVLAILAKVYKKGCCITEEIASELNARNANRTAAAATVQPTTMWREDEMNRGEGLEMERRLAMGRMGIDVEPKPFIISVDGVQKYLDRPPEYIPPPTYAECVIDVEEPSLKRNHKS